MEDIHENPFAPMPIQLSQFKHSSQVPMYDVPCSNDAASVGEDIEMVKQEGDEDAMSVEEPIDSINWKTEVRGVGHP